MVNKLPPELECPIDHVLIQFIDTHLPWYYTLGFTPNMVTTLSIIFGFWAAYLIRQRKQLGWAAIIFFVSYYFDCVDGKLARQYNMQTEFGDFYDHFGDITKFSAVLYALFTFQKGGLVQTRQILLTIIIALCVALSFVHMGYQEIIYNNAGESRTLQSLKKFVALDKTPEKTIRLTRHFGCGTLVAVMTGAIYFWTA